MRVQNTIPLRVVLPAVAAVGAVLATYALVFADASAQSSHSSRSGIQPASRAGALCNFGIDTYNDDPNVQAQSMAVWTCDSAERALLGNGIPNHAVGEFPNDQNPTGISEQEVNQIFTLAPTLSSEGAVAEMTPGYALNSVKFEPATAGTCTDAGECDPTGANRGAWRMEALTSTAFGFGTDENNAHVQPNGQYHYHGMPEGLLTALDRRQRRTSMQLVGWAVDGFPIYARYGYLDSSQGNATQGARHGGRRNLAVLKGSYQLKATPDPGRPSLEVYNMGSFNQDWEYVAGSGDLDECNGRTGVTPEFPQGTYYYAITDTYPFIQRCLKGVYEGGQPPPPVA